MIKRKKRFFKKFWFQIWNQREKTLQNHFFSQDYLDFFSYGMASLWTHVSGQGKTRWESMKQSFEHKLQNFILCLYSISFRVLQADLLQKLWKLRCRRFSISPSSVILNLKKTYNFYRVASWSSKNERV